MGRRALDARSQGYASRGGSIDGYEERLALLDYVGGELGCFAAARVPDGMHGFRRNQQAFACAEGLSSTAVDPVLQGAFQHVDDLLARVLVPQRGSVRIDFDAVLDQLAPWDAEL